MQAKNPQYLAENLLNRQFYAEKPNEKWLTDVTEFKWYEGIEVHKLYLSAILDLCDRRIVSYVLSEHNDNPLVSDRPEAVKYHAPEDRLLTDGRRYRYDQNRDESRNAEKRVGQPLARPQNLLWEKVCHHHRQNHGNPHRSHPEQERAKQSGKCRLVDREYIFQISTK